MTRTTEPPPPDTGYAAYTPRLLRVYDTVVLRLSNRLLWKCPASILLAQYDDFIAPVHLDVGPGTGFFLDRCAFPVERPELTLVDANHHVLEYASRRLARYRPTTVHADIRQPVPLPGGRYGSVALSYVLHCLPGTMAGKRNVFENLRPLLQPDGVVFGSTILGRSPAHTRRSAAVQRLYNQRGLFGNADDDLEGLQAALASSFARFQVDTRGTVALFAGWVS
jgi:SAM-dependent methyltransferase